MLKKKTILTDIMLGFTQLSFTNKKLYNIWIGSQNGQILTVFNTAPSDSLQSRCC